MTYPPLLGRPVDEGDKVRIRWDECSIPSMVEHGLCIVRVDDLPGLVPLKHAAGEGRVVAEDGNPGVPRVREGCERVLVISLRLDTEAVVIAVALVADRDSPVRQARQD